MTHWNDVRHGPLRLGVTTDQPQVPSLLYPVGSNAPRHGALRLGVTSDQPQISTTVEIVDTEMKDREDGELTTEEIAGIQLPPSNHSSPLSTPASPPAEKRGEGESGPTASVTHGTTPPLSTCVNASVTLGSTPRALDEPKSYENNFFF
ncbi:hypothetical protein C8R47DRAFT_1206214 [Mycena vitilis]|nr:hypothetical protein C8R47DRAFT_1216116 [Mycena vitilis]KAJ6514859.1 hypothetical protein C8R47DRAFT_1206214 [Mycena vitilis]